MTETDKIISNTNNPNRLQMWWSYHKSWMSRWLSTIRPKARENMLGALSAVIGAWLGWHFGFIPLDKLYLALLCAVGGYLALFLVYSISHAIFIASRMHFEKMTRIRDLEFNLKAQEQSTSVAEEKYRIQLIEVESLTERVQSAEGELGPKKRELADVYAARLELQERWSKSHDDWVAAENKCRILEETLTAAKDEIAIRDAEIEELKTSPHVGCPRVNEVFIDAAVLHEETARLKPDHSIQGQIQYGGSVHAIKVVPQYSQLLLDLLISNSGVPTTIHDLELFVNINGVEYIGQLIAGVTNCYVEKELISGEKASRQRIEKQSIDLDITAHNPLTRALPRNCWAHFLVSGLEPKEYKAATFRLVFKDGIGAIHNCTDSKDFILTKIKTDYTAMTIPRAELERWQR
ncbi:MAG TPA: hypothetical protein VFK06_03395 [Candidatus Angelobacter sp.]|nr:hypothetical protein [Candidatus Angelobacter sp.]